MSPFPSCRLRAALTVLTGLAMAALGGPPAARAADFGAKANGNWNSSFTWTPTGGPPGASDNAYIGSTFPGGAATTATVNLTQNQQARDVYLGYGVGTSGTLNLGDFNLTADRLYLGLNGGTGAVTRGTGSLNLFSLRSYASTLAMNGSDRTQFLGLEAGSSVTTAATANVSGGISVLEGSTLTLGADLSVSGLVNVLGNSTLDAQGHKITALHLTIDGAPNVGLLNKGDLDVSILQVHNQNLNLTATDKVTTYGLVDGSTTFAPGAAVSSLNLSRGSTATTTAVGNITFEVMVGPGSTLTLGADLDVTALSGSGSVTVGGG